MVISDGDGHAEGSPLSGRETAPVDNPDAVAAFEERSRNVLSCVILNVDPRKLYLIGRPKTAKAAWDKIRALFYKSSWNRRLVLRDRLAGLRMNDGDDLEAHLEELIILLRQLTLH